MHTLILERSRVLSYFTKLAAELWPMFNVGWDFNAYLDFYSIKALLRGFNLIL